MPCSTNLALRSLQLNSTSFFAEEHVGDSTSKSTRKENRKKEKKKEKIK
jgi:hypothetical protein